MQEEGSKEKIQCVLKVLKEEFDLGTMGDTNWVDIPAKNFQVCGLDNVNTGRVLNRLKSQKILVDAIFFDSREAKYEEEYDYDVWRIRFSYNFEQLYTEYNKASIEYNPNIKDNKIILQINNNGEIWREPKKKYCCKMEPNKNRFKMLKFLIKYRDYQLTDDISDHLGGKGKQQIMNDLNKIDKNLRNALNLSSDVIEGKKGSEYRINPIIEFLNSN